MNKRNKILVGCLALLLVLSAGYALFSETITINGTATAKGNFDITVTCVKGLSEETGLEMSDVDGGDDYTEGGYENDTCDVVDNKVSLGVNLKYPGAKRFFTMKTENTGSIPAELDFMSSTEGDGLYTTVSVCKINADGSTDTCSSRINNNRVFYTDLIGFGDENGFYTVDSDEVMNFLDANMEKIVLEPGESVYHLMGFVWYDSYTSDTNSANYKIDVTAELPYTQVTAN